MTEDGWPARVGEDAATMMRRATVAQRSGGVAGLLFVALEVIFQVAGEYRPGIEWSALLFAVMVLGFVLALRYMARARRLVAERVGLPRKDAKWVRLQHGLAGYDYWLACRGQPNWPRIRPSRAARGLVDEPAHRPGDRSAGDDGSAR